MGAACSYNNHRALADLPASRRDERSGAYHTDAHICEDLQEVSNGKNDVTPTPANVYGRTTGHDPRTRKDLRAELVTAAQFHTPLAVWVGVCEAV